MTFIRNNKFFGKYLPMFLSVVLVMVTLFGWYVFKQSKRVAAAIALTNKENNVSTSFPTTTTGSLTWTAGARGIASVVLACPGGGVPNSGEVQVAGGSETWTQIGFVAYNRRGVYVFLSDSVPTNGTLSITYDNGPGTDCNGAGTPQEIQYAIDQMTGFDTGNPDDPSNTGSAGSGTSLNIGDVGTIDAGDVVYAAFGMENANDGLVPASGSTAHVTREGGGNVRSLLVAYSTTDDTPGATWNSSGSSGGVAFIINVGAEPPVDSSNPNIQIRGGGTPASPNPYVKIRGGSSGGGGAPTLSDYQAASWTDSSTEEVTPSLTWSSGDVVVCVGGTRDSSYTLNTPTASGLTFSLIISASGNTRAYAWSATAGSGGSGAVTATSDGTNTFRGLSCFVYSGSDGIGNSAVIESSSAKTISLARNFNNSAVITVLSDWNAVGDTTVTSDPAGGTERVAINVGGVYSAFVFNWGDQGLAGTTSYGITDHTGSVNISGIAVEVKGSSGGGTSGSVKFR